MMFYLSHESMLGLRGVRLSSDKADSSLCQLGDIFGRVNQWRDSDTKTNINNKITVYNIDWIFWLCIIDTVSFDKHEIGSWA
jgi:hypothetical protein